MTTPSGQAIGYTYQNGRLAGITVNGATLITAADYEPFGPVSVWQWGNGHNKRPTATTTRTAGLRAGIREWDP